MSTTWSREEVEATVATYLQMLTLELTGQKYSKAEYRRQLLRMLNDRTEGAVERKHQNVSAVLIELGCPYISGYKPLGNYQQLLADVVEVCIAESHVFDDATLSAVQMPAVTSTPVDFTRITVEPPRLQHTAREPGHTNRRVGIKRDYIDREARNASLGLAGEKFVVEYERWSLVSRGQERLADKVEHISQTQGDGLGYDVLSFDVRGREKLIEVKTTSFGKETPFFVTQSEVDMSRAETDHWHLYRLFEFRKAPHFFSIRGAVDEHCHLNPITYRATFS